LEVIAPTLSLFPLSLLRLCADHGTRIRVIGLGETFKSASLFISELCAEIDDWKHPPAGLFVVNEKTAYLRSVSPMTIAHEFGHAIDAARGGERYCSQYSHELRALFENAPGFVTPYAASRIDEYWAECMRAWVGVNDADCSWPDVSRSKLKKRDPDMYAHIKSFVEFPT